MTAPAETAEEILARVAPAVLAAADQPAHTGHLPAEFWNARPILGRIRQFAHARGVSGDVLLYSFLARLSGMLPHHIQAVSGIGGRASLNLFVAAVGGSGVGKSTGSKVNRDLLAASDPEFRDGLPIGSGEGIAEAFMGTIDEETGEVRKGRDGTETPVTRKVRKQVRHNAFFYVDEGQLLAKLGERTGSTLGETLRRAAIGETLGQTNASEERTRYVEGGTYSLGLLVGFQPSTAMPVLDDAATGTPQRFLWCWAADPSIPDEQPADPGALDGLACLQQPGGPVDVTFPDSIRTMLWRQHVAKNRGELVVAELDAHAGLIKVKASALLALLDGRYEVTEDDWHLAETMWAASCAVRDHLLARAKREAAAARQAAEDAHVQAEVKAHEAKSRADSKLARVAQRVRTLATRVGGISHGELRRTIAYRDRDVLEAAVDLAVSRGWVFEEDDRVCAAVE
ncbi:hypothetical protein [Streptomyces sp. NPDC056821]|uniref:hypothetical protein n=1 Tax=unclassified Streptomyces TaxID=2593676 RepID=UPI0036CA12C6